MSANNAIVINHDGDNSYSVYYTGCADRDIMDGSGTLIHSDMNMERAIRSAFHELFKAEGDTPYSVEYGILYRHAEGELGVLGDRDSDPEWFTYVIDTWEDEWPEFQQG